MRKQRFNMRQGGASMVEVIITLLIVTAGLLGLGSLLINSIKYQKTASQRSEAVQSAYDLSERMRANGLGVTANNYITNDSYSSMESAALPTIPTCSAVKCTPVEIANIDIADWRRNLAQRLVGGAGNILAGPGRSFDVVVMWKERTEVADAAFVDPACPAGGTAPGAGVRCFVVRFEP